MKKNKTQTVTLDAISRIVREGVGGMKKDIGSIKARLNSVDQKLSGVDKRLNSIDRKVSGIDRRLKDFSQDYTEADLETRVIHLENTLGVSVPVKE